MNETLGDDLEKILDGDYVLLRRKSCKEVPVLCLYGMYKEDAEEIERKMLKDGTVQSTLQFQLSNKMYDEFLNADLTMMKNRTLEYGDEFRTFSNCYRKRT